MMYVILGLTFVSMFIILVMAFAYIDKNNDSSNEKYEWED